MTEHALGPRAEAMAGRIAAAARRAGLADAGIQAVTLAFSTAMRPREARLADDHHPDYLHPGRTTLILLEDLGVLDPATLAAGALAESLRPTLAAEPDEFRHPAAHDALRLLRQVPVPALAGDALLERLAAADQPARLVALAERLDHARHLHLRDRSEWAPLHAQTCAVYAPLAALAHATLDRRFRWWCDMFERRYLRP